MVPPKHHSEARITAVMKDTRSDQTAAATSYEQRIGEARNRRRLSQSSSRTDLLATVPSPEGVADKSETLVSGVVTTTPSQVLANLADYEKLEPKSGESSKYTVPIKDMPEWYVDNVFLLRGYRRITNSYLGCVKSLAYLHNETGNVLSHGFGALGFVILAQVFYGWLTVETSTWADVLIMGAFFLGAVVCLGLSTTFHLCCCHSRGVAAIWLRGDYVGIVTLIMGSLVPSIYYGFFCNPSLQALYLTVVILAGIITISITVSPRFFAPKYRLLRTGLFVSMGATGAVPLIHALTKYGYHTTRNALSSSALISSGVVYFLGAVIYACRVPERWWPGKFDMWGHSHQIFHVLVVAGALIHCRGVITQQRWWHTHNPYCIA
ncbi:hypothetical protein HDU86_004852 [Geranomyces michiganensis]|nr:hypothetical protein HDU86_004852 [Geranomyces michiganensis]